jgi:hypothetical protein
LRWLVYLVVARGSCACLQAQVTAAAGIAPTHSTQNLAKVPRVPGVSTLFDGFNAGVTYSGVHDSASGWYSVVTPAVSYTFSDRYSADASASIYFHRLVQNTNPATAATQPLVVEPINAGDTLIGFHAFFEPGSLQNTITGSLTAPTGDQSQGLGAGQVTYDFSNHAERYYKKVGFLVDVGAGDSSGLFNSVVSKDYSSVGPLAHFQAGLVVWLPHRTYIQSVAYEQLPLGSQTVYRTVKRGEHDQGEDDGGGGGNGGGGNGGGGNPPPAPTPTATSGAIEDNGFTTIVGVPLNDYLTLSGYYNRSLRQDIDTVSFGMTYVIRGRRKRTISMIDKAIRAAEGADP